MKIDDFNLSDINNFKIKGFMGTTILDFPEKVASIIFTGSCNFKCPYCHNREIAQNPQAYDTIPLEFFFDTIDKRKNFIDGLVISGGEPTIQKDLIKFCRIFKKKYPKLEIKIDTNGSHPYILAELIENKLVDYIAMDLKTSPEKYDIIPGGNSEKILKSLKIISKSNIDHEFRVTCFRNYALEINPKGLKKYINKNDKIYLQKCISPPNQDESNLETENYETLSKKEVLIMAKDLEKCGFQVELRGY